jgi:hypothetical protein
MESELIEGFLVEIKTNYRSNKFSELLEKADTELINKAYITALEIINNQYALLMGTRVTQFIQYDKLHSEYRASRFPIEYSTSDNIPFNAEYLTTFNSLATLLNIDIDLLVFCLVEGESMIDANIYNNEILVVEKLRNINEINNNSIVVAKIYNNYYVKRYRVENNTQWLFSENKEYEPIRILDDMGFEIYGIVKFVIKAVN